MASCNAMAASHLHAVGAGSDVFLGKHALTGLSKMFCQRRMIAGTKTLAQKQVSFAPIQDNSRPKRRQI